MTQKTVKIILPFPPSVNALFGGGSRQKRFPSKQYKDWLLKCPDLFPEKMDKVSIEYMFYFPDNRERDSQNYIKAVTDYLVKKEVIINDSWKNIIREIITPMGIDKNLSRVEIVIQSACCDNSCTSNQ